ncbi:MAG TPA: FAD-dependent oxidoreductase [Fontimonas sp.]
MTTSVHQTDVIVVGAGIAGVGMAAQLGSDRRVVVLEQEAQPGYHTTGRSAAVFAESYGGTTVRQLTRGSRGFFADPPAGFAEHPLLTPRGFLFIARHDQREALEAFAALPDMRATARRLDPAAACAHMPLLRREYVADALLDHGASDIDVHALLQGYVAMLRRNGGRIVGNARVTGIERSTGGWRVSSEAGLFEAPLLVNAAGAWADELAALAGVAAIGLQPMRRTAALVDVPSSEGMAQWPLTIDIDETFYFKPDAGRLLISPGDETPSEPCDASPDDLDLAIAVERIETATTLDIRRMHSRWAGLRSFVGDRSPVAGFAPDAAGFFWLAGQGGYGIQTAPALSRAAAALLLDRPLPADLLDLGVTAAALSPRRLQAAP